MLRAFRSHHAPLGLLGAVVAAFLVEAAVARRDADLSRPETIDHRFSRRAARRDAPGRDVLVFGTSMNQMGLLPAELERQTGLKAFNLAVGGGRCSFAYFLLAKAVRAGARPSAVLIDVHPWTIGTDYRKNFTGWPEVFDPADAVDMAWTARDGSYLAARLVAYALPSARHRLRIREAVVKTLAARDWSLRHISFIHGMNRRLNKGALTGPRRPEYRGEVSAQYRSMLLTPPGPPDPQEWYYLEQFVALAGRAGARVYWVIPPLAPALQAERGAKGLDARYDRLIARLRQSFPNVSVLDARGSGFTADVFLDASHLDPKGGTALTRMVAGALLQDAAAPEAASRVASLPPYQPFPYEEATPTRLAVERGATRTRE